MPKKHVVLVPRRNLALFQGNMTWTRHGLVHAKCGNAITVVSTAGQVANPEFAIHGTAHRPEKALSILSCTHCGVPGESFYAQDLPGHQVAELVL